MGTLSLPTSCCASVYASGLLASTFGCWPRIPADPVRRLCQTTLRPRMLPYLSAAWFQSAEWQAVERSSHVKGIKTGGELAELAPAVAADPKPQGLVPKKGALEVHLSPPCLALAASARPCYSTWPRWAAWRGTEGCHSQPTIAVQLLSTLHSAQSWRVAS